MRRSRLAAAVGLLLVLASGIGWLALRSRPPAITTNPVVATASPPIAQTIDASAEALRFLISAKAGQVTAGDIIKQRELLLNRSRESRAALERGLRSENRFERLIAFRLLLELDGWSSQLSAAALQDSFVLLRVEAADWLYLTRHLGEWDMFLSAAAKNSTADYIALKPAAQHLRWDGMPAGADMLGLDRGLDRYFRELLRRSDSTASLAENDLSSSAVPATEQQALLRLLQAANRSDYETLLQKTLARSDEDTPVRYEAIWLFGQAFATPANRDLFIKHLAANATDPLRLRAEQALTNINEQIALGSDSLTRKEARLATASKTGLSAEFGAALIALLDEALRSSRVPDAMLLLEVKRILPTQNLDYAAQRRAADIDFLISRSK